MSNGHNRCNGGFELLGKILIVDDDASILRLVGEYLRRRGWIVHTSETTVGLEALIATHCPDVVLCDLCVPDRDAVEFLLDRVARDTDESIQQTPIVIMSAHDFVDDAIDTDMKVAAVVRKPFDLDTLGALIESVTGCGQRTVHR